MALLVPNIEASPTFDAQAIPDATDLAAQIAATAPVETGVVSGCAVSPQSSPNMTVKVAAGTIIVNGTQVAVTAVSSLSIAAADATDRRDIVVVNNAGTVSVVTGTDCGTAGWSRTTPNPLTTNPPPVKPSIPANSVMLAEVYVASSTTSIAAGNLIDKTAPSAGFLLSSNGKVTVSGTPSAGQVLTATGPAAADWATPTPFPLPGAVTLMGHSYLGAVNIGIPEPEAQAKYVSSRVAAVLGASSSSVKLLAKAGGFLVDQDGPDGCSWGSVLQRIVPSTGAGLAAVSGGSLLLPGQVNPPIPAAGQPTCVGLMGSNDALPLGGFAYGGAGSTFTASGGTTGATATVTTTTNLSSTGTAFAGRAGGNGLHVGDYIIASFTRGYAQVSAVNWNGTITTLTFNNGPQITTTPSGTVTMYFGNFSQLQTAAVNSWTAIIARCLAGAIVRSDDAAITYTGTWTTVTQNTGNTGPSIRQTVVNNSELSYTLPATHPGGMVRLIFVGTSDLDNTGASINIGGTAAYVSSGYNVVTARAGWNGVAAPIVVSIPTTGADAGKTITATYIQGSGASQVQFDSINFDGIYQSPFILTTQPLGPIGYAASIGVTAYADLNAAMQTVVTNFQTAPGAVGTYPGGFPSMGSVTPNGTNVVLADFAQTINKRSFYLGTSISGSGSTSSSITLIGQTTTALGQVAPWVGQLLGIPNPTNPGDQSELVFVTSVASPGTVTIGGTTYPTWVVGFNRNVITTGAFANFQQNAATGSTSSLISPLYDLMWMAGDWVHPGDSGAALVASTVLQAFLAVPSTSNYDQIAAASQKWTQGRDQAAPRILDGGYWRPRGTTSTFVMAANTAYAVRFYTPEWIIVDEIGVSVVTGAAGSLFYAGIAQDVSYGSFPGDIIYDFGMASVGSAATALIGVIGYYMLPPGWYWIVVAENSTAGATVRSITTRFDDPVIWEPNATNLAGTAAGIIGYSWTVAGPGNPLTNLGVSGTPAGIQASGSGMPKPFVHAYAAKYSTSG